ncbi:DNA-directed DNA polymerase [Tanacetum coccineum]
MENIMYFNNGAGPSSSFRTPLTQEEAKKRALAHNIDMRLDGMIKPEEERVMVKVKGHMLKEKKDPGAFLFLIRLEGRINKNALADTGFDTNTMPYRIYEQLGRDDIMKEERNITMINYTEAKVTRRLVNVLCQVGFTTLSAKFLILEIPVDRDAPIMVGRGFIDTIRGNINIPNRIFTTFDGLTRQTFKTARSEKIRTAESDSDDTRCICDCVGSILAKNMGLLGKWKWRFLVEKNALWRTMIKDFYGLDGGFERLSALLCLLSISVVRFAMILDLHGVREQTKFHWKVGCGPTGIRKGQYSVDKIRLPPLGFSARLALRLENIRQLGAILERVVVSVKPQWKPTGRHFALYDTCPLTRIMEPIVEPLELTPSVSSSSKFTMISRFPDCKTLVIVRLVPTGISWCSIRTVIIDPHGIRANDDSKYPMQDMLISLPTVSEVIKKAYIQSFRTISENQCLLQMLNVMEIRRRYIIKAFQIPTDMSIKDQDQVIKSSSEDHDQGNLVFDSDGDDKWCLGRVMSLETYMLNTSLKLNSSTPRNLLLANDIIDKHYIWKSWIPKKVNICMWRASLDRLPTRTNLSYRAVDLPSSNCPMCSNAPEEIDHCNLVFDSDGDDKWVWKGDVSGNLKVKSLSKSLQNLLLANDIIDKHCIWNSWISCC